MDEHIRAEHIERALGRPSEEWKSHARELLARFAATRAPFSAVDLWKAGLEPLEEESRAIGGIFCGAARSGRIKTTGQYVVNPLAKKNGTSIREWVGV